MLDRRGVVADRHNARNRSDQQLLIYILMDGDFFILAVAMPERGSLVTELFPGSDELLAHSVWACVDGNCRT